MAGAQPGKRARAQSGSASLDSLIGEFLGSLVDPGYDTRSHSFVVAIKPEPERPRGCDDENSA
jgi:hypothetical protein